MTTILVVDDNAEIRGIYSHVLKRANYKVLEAENGVNALEMMATTRPDAIIIDMLMPMMSGDLVLKYLHNTPDYQDIKTIVITAYPRFRETAMEFEIHQFLVKPVRPEDILNAVKAALDSGTD